MTKRKTFYTQMSTTLKNDTLELAMPFRKRGTPLGNKLN